MNSIFFQVASTLISLLIGIGVAWGAMKSTVQRLTEKVDDLDLLVPRLLTFEDRLRTTCNTVDHVVEQLTEVRIQLAEVKTLTKGKTL